MGAWGTGNFENDSALDLLDEFEEILDKEWLMRKITSCLEEDYVDAVDASEAIAAIELVAVALGKPALTYAIDKDLFPYEAIDQFVTTTMRQQLTKQDIEQCVNAVNQITNKEISELYQLRDESDDFSEWLDTVNELKNRLQ